MAYSDFSANIALIKRVQNENQPEVDAVTEVNLCGEFLVGNGTEADHLAPPVGNDLVIVSDLAEPICVKWASPPNIFDQSLNTTDSPQFVGLTLTGDLTVSGTTTTINSTTLTVDDPLNKFADGNTADAVDQGWYAEYDAAGTSKYSGCFRAAGTNKFKLFTALTEEPTTTVNTAHGTYLKACLELGSLDLCGSTSGKVTLKAPATPTDWSMCFPPAAPGSTEKSIISSDGAGATIWGDRVRSLTAASNGGLAAAPSTITTTGAFSLDVNNLPVAPALATGDFLAMHDVDVPGTKKVTVTTLNALLDHDSLTGFVADEHVPHASVLIQGSADSAITVDGAQAAVNMQAGTKQLKVDIAGTTTVFGGTLAAGDEMLVQDVSVPGLRKATLTELGAALPPLVDHDLLTNYVANEHVDHTAVFLQGTVNTSGIRINGLTSAVDLTAGTKQITVDIFGTTINTAPLVSNEMLTQLSGGGPLQKSTLAQMAASITGTIDHDMLLNYVADQHVAHSGVSVLKPAVDTGLAVANDDLTADFDLTVDIDSVALDATPALSNEVLSQVTAGGILQKSTLAHVNSALVHDNLSGFVADEHVAHSGVSVVAGGDDGLLAANNDLTSNLGLAVDIGGTSSNATPPTTHEVLLQTTGSGALEKSTLAQVNAVLDHDSLSGFVADEHVAHSGVSVVAGGDDGLLAANNDLTTNLGLAVDIDGTTAETTPDQAADKVMIHDSGVGLRSMLINNMLGAGLNLGSVSAAATVTSNGGTAFHKATVLTLGGSNTYTITAAAAEGHSLSLYTFPTAGVAIHSIVMSVALTGTGTVNADTPELGVGTTAATGAISVLSGTPTDENLITGTATADVAGATTTVLTAPNYPDGSGFTIYLNVADTWAGADTVTATGTVKINWSYLP